MTRATSNENQLTRPKPPSPRRRNFASDNASGMCPEAWSAMAEANAAGHLPSYGDDLYTQRASDAFRELFETDCDVYFCFNGTAANSLALASLCQSYHSVICHESSHIETDECGAPEFYSNGSKLLLCPGALGKLTHDVVRAVARKRSDIHYLKPRAISITQPTELGTTYSPDELSTLTAIAAELGMKVQMDGARFSNAVASIGKSPAELTWKAGVDVLCFGGSKNGMAVGEAVIFFDHRLSLEFDARCKQAGQLASKMRFLAAPWLGLLHDGAWLRNGTHANAMAQRLAAGIAKVPGLCALYPVQANSVFVELPAGTGEALRQRGWLFYNFIGGGARLMCSWDTQPEDVDAVLGDLTAIMHGR